MQFQKKVPANDNSHSAECAIRQHFLEEFRDCRYNNVRDKLVLGEQVASPHRHIRLISRCRGAATRGGALS